MGKKHFCFFQTADTGNRTPYSGVKGSGANHYPRVPARLIISVSGFTNEFVIILSICDDIPSWPELFLDFISEIILEHLLTLQFKIKCLLIFITYIVCKRWCCGSSGGGGDGGGGLTLSSLNLP